MDIQVDRLIRSKRRTIALIVERDGSLTVRAPMRMALRDVEAFIREKTEWILRTRERFKSMARARTKQYVDGEMFLFLGHAYPLRLVKPQRPALKFEDGFTLGHTAKKRGEQVFTRWYREQAFAVLSGRVKEMTESHALVPKEVRITSARTRWGSCSPDGTLNFTWRLVLAPMEVIDYVVAHELAHLRVKNHSRRFWRAVEGILPDYRARRKWLRENGEKLGL